MKNKVLEKKNYIFMALITVAVVVLTFYISSWYKIIKKNRENTSVVEEVVTKIDASSLSSYLLDNPNALIYIASSNDPDIKDFESSLKKYIVNEELTSTMIYLDTKDMTQDDINKIFLPYVSSTIKLKNIVTANILYFEDREIVDAIYTKNSVAKINDVKTFLEGNSIVND